MVKKVLTAVFFVLAISFIAFAQDTAGADPLAVTAAAQTTAAQSIIPQAAPKLMSFALCMLAAGIALGFAALGVAVGMGLGLSKAMEAIGRNPEAHSKVQTLLLIGLAFLETVVIYGLVFGLILVFSNPVLSL